MFSLRQNNLQIKKFKQRYHISPCICNNNILLGKQIVIYNRRIWNGKLSSNFSNTLRAILFITKGSSCQEYLVYLCTCISNIKVSIISLQLALSTVQPFGHVVRWEKLMVTRVRSKYCWRSPVQVSHYWKIILINNRKTWFTTFLEISPVLFISFPNWATKNLSHLNITLNGSISLEMLLVVLMAYESKCHINNMTKAEQIQKVAAFNKALSEIYYNFKSPNVSFQIYFN